MGKKLDALFGRTFKSQKFKSLLNLSLTRLSILKNQREVRFSHATSDVSELLKLGKHEIAFHRVDQVIKDQNMLDVFDFIHGYCNVLLDHVHLLEQHKECPEELLEAVSSLLFAASRIGEFPELQQIRNVLISRFGKELAARSIELRSNCGVNIKMVQKLSTRQPPRELRMKVLKEIAAENNIVLKLEESSSSSSNQGTLEVSKAKLTSEDRAEEIGEDYEVSDSVKRGKKKYKDVADAAQAAFESAAHAAEAARAAVELSQFSPRGPDNHDYPGNISSKKSSNGFENKKPESDQEQGNDFSEDEGSRQGSKRSMSDSEETIDEVSVSLMSFREDPVKLLEKDVAIYDSEEETQYDIKTSKITVKDEVDPMDGSNRVHLDYMVHLGGSPISRNVGVKGPVSVRTTRVRGY